MYRFIVRIGMHEEEVPLYDIPDYILKAVKSNDKYHGANYDGELIRIECIKE